MTFTIHTLTAKGLEKNDYRNIWVMTELVDGVERKFMSFRDGELEDNSIDRNFNDIRKIDTLIAKVGLADGAPEVKNVQHDDPDELWEIC